MGNPIMRAKLRVDCVKSYGNDKSPEFEDIDFSAVCRSEGYPEDGSDENNTFARWTPMADLHMAITNPGLFGKIKEGDEFYLDFTKAE